MANPNGAGAPPQRRNVPQSSRVTLSKGGAKSGASLLAQRKAEKEPLDHIEDRVFSLPGFDKAPEPGLLKEFIEHVATKLKLPRTSHGILTSFVNIDVTAEKVSACLKANPYYEFQFFNMIQSMGKRENLPSTEGALILLGMQNSRNLVIGLQMLRSITGQHPEWSKEGKLKVVPSDLVKYALKSEELLAGDKSGYADTAYAAGLVFDYLALLADQVVEDKKAMAAFVDATYTHGLLAARVGAELAKSVPQFSFTKYAFSACLLHDVGKIVLAILNGNYLPFSQEISNRGVPRPVRIFAEEREFGYSHALLGGLCCGAFRLFKPIERAVFFHHDPYLLKNVNRNLFQLSSLICLATNMASNLKKVDKSDDPILASWKGPELKDFRIDSRSMMAAAAKAL